jgi:hypothetical protein
LVGALIVSLAATFYGMANWHLHFRASPPIPPTPRSNLTGSDKEMQYRLEMETYEHTLKAYQERSVTEEPTLSFPISMTMSFLGIVVACVCLGIIGYNNSE